MCGIAGIVGFDGTPVECADIKRMTDAIAHRGPDGEGQWCEDSVGLGHRRLAIIDLSEAAAQPMHSRDGRYVITYNGEVYNYADLRRELERTGSRFISQSDTEVVLEAVIRWGIDAAIRRFNGMFAFAIWDRQNRRLLVGRDRYGIKPLYIWQSTGQIAIASEPKAFRRLAGFSPILDAEGLAEYFTFQNILSNRTFLRGVSVFPPGNWAEVSTEDGALNMSRYWEFSFHEPSHPGSDEEYAEELGRLLEQAVNRQLVSDVEVGSFLSGGLDSGSIVAIAARHLPGMKAFTVGFELDFVADDELNFDERSAAAEIAALVGATQFEMLIGPEHVRKCLPKLVRHLEEPRVGQSYPNYYAAELASRFVKVAFAGTGGDEILGGYPWRYPPEGMALSDLDTWHFNIWRRLLTEGQVKSFLAPLGEELAGFNPREVHRKLLASDKLSLKDGTDPLSAALNFEAKTFLPGLLAVEDRLSMAHGLEVRVPFLDNDLVEFCQGLPRPSRLGRTVPKQADVRLWRKTSNGKQLLRQAMKGALPDRLLRATKQGFSGPDTMWFAHHLKSDVIDCLKSIDPEFTDSLVVADLLMNSQESPGSSRLLSWSLMAASMHLRDYWPSGTSLGRMEATE